jgi:hypothetical protein
MLPLEPKKHEQSIEVEKGNIGEWSVYLVEDNQNPYKRN